MLTVAKIAAGAPSGMGGMSRHMLTQTVPKEVADLGRYYTRENEIEPDHARLRHDMHPIVAKGLGVDPQKPVNMDQINALLAGRRADGQKIEGKTYSELREYTDKKTGEQKTMVPIGSVDFCFTPHKSVSLAWAFGVPAEQAAVFQAHVNASEKAMAYVELEMAKATKGKGGQDGWDQGHLGFVYFDHYTARPTVDIQTEVDGKLVTEPVVVPVAGDPDLHRHHIVMNAVFCENGRVGSMDLDRLDGFIKEAGALYQAFLAQDLRDKGAHVVIDEDTGAARLPAIGEDMCRSYSKRTVKGEDAAREYAAKNGLEWDDLNDSRRSALLKKAVQSVPKGLDDDTVAKLKKDDMADFAAWRKQAAELNWHHETIFRKPEGPEIMGPHQQITPEKRYEIAHPVANQWLEKDGVNQRAVISEGQVRTAAARSLIVSGISDYRDISGVVTEMMTKGITQYGEKTSLISGQESDKRRLSYTTALHERDEGEFISKAKRASEDMSKALEPERLKAAIERSGLKFEDDHGKAQLKAIHQIGEGGALTVMIGAAGAGKAQPIDANVLTPLGFRPIGRIRAGDIVTTPDGQHVSVIGVFPQGAKEIFRVTFEDGRTVECCGDHLWKVWENTSTYVLGSGAKAPKKTGWGWRVRPLKDIKGWFDRDRFRVRRTAVPLVSPMAMEFPPQDLPISPYALGALLGDGHFANSVSFSTADLDLLERLMSELPAYEPFYKGQYDYGIRLRSREGLLSTKCRLLAHDSTHDYPRIGERKDRIVTYGDTTQTISAWSRQLGISRRKVYERLCRSGWPVASALGFSPPPAINHMFSPLQLALRQLGLEGARSHNKFVPDLYKNASISQRLALIQGLLDTDGSIEGGKGTYATFSSTSERLAKDVQWLAWSLGSVAKISARQTHYRTKDGELRAGRPSWRVSIVHPMISAFFSLQRKVMRCHGGETRTAQRLCITGVESIGTKDALCIAVDHPDHLYVTDNFVVTHNTTLLQPLVDAWQEEGRRVYGMALAWRQADDLIDAGIKRNDTKGVDDSKAISVFLSEVSKGKIELDSKSVIVVDELSLLGTRQGLDLLRLREKHDSQLVMIGDDKQCQAISAGPIIELARKALGPEKIPEILSTIRQETERERDIAGLFRAGDAGIALAMKREDKTVELAPGSYAKVTERVAELMAERVKENGHDKRYSITLSAPTNADAHDLSVAIRDTRRAMGLIGKDLVTIKAAGGENDKIGYEMKIAAGDKVRLFKNVSAQGRRGGSLGRNGSVVTVVRADKDGVVLQPPKGKKEGYVPWEKLVQNGKIRLAYGDVMTTHTAQGSTATEHIYAMPGGTKAVNGFSSYSSGTRHRQKSFMVISERAERAEVKERRPVNDPRPIKSDDLWGNAARNLGYQPVKSTATDFIKRASNIERGSASALQRGLQPGEVRERQGLAPTTIHIRNHQRQTVHDIGMVAMGLEAQSKNLNQTVDTLSQAIPRIGPAVEVGIQRVVREAMDGTSPQVTGPDRGARRFQAVVENIPREHIDALKRSVSISHLIGQSVKLDAHGKGLCPFHNEKTPSFHVNEKKGVYKCFGCGESGDTVKWLTEGRGMPFHQALDYLSGKSGIQLPAPRLAVDKPGHKTVEWSAVLPVPEKAPPLIRSGGWTAEVFNPRAAERGQDRTSKPYKPDHVASYQDAEGRQIGYVLRMEMSDGSKYTPQIAWAVPSNAPTGSDPIKIGRWALVTMGDAKPMYRAEELARHPEKTVIVVMGEKKADALQKIVGNGAVVVSWAGGDNGRHTTDFSPLRGRNVIIWPDADVGGKAAAIGERTNAGEIKKGVAEYAHAAGALGVKVIVPPSSVPKGWDAGDLIKSGADRNQVKKFISEKAVGVEAAKKVLEPQIVQANVKAQEVLKANAEIRKAEAQKKTTATMAPDAAPSQGGQGKTPVNKVDIQPRKGHIRGPSRKR